jgi:TolB protein
MYRLLLLALALPLAATADLGRAAADEYNVDIVAVDLGGRETNLSHDPAVDVAPAVARDGRIAFVSTRNGTGAELYVMDGDGRDVRRLTTNAGVTWNEALDVTGGSWAPGGEKLAFDGLYLARGTGCSQHCANWKVSVVGADGSGLEQVALEARAPAWSPDGRFLAYESDLDAYYVAGTVTIARLDGSRSVRIKAINGTSDVGPVWSPRGGEIAFQASPAGGRSWIYVARTDGRTRRLTAGHNPTWSRDGRRLAFIDGYKLWTIGKDGKGRRRLSRKGEFVVGTAWSPKGGAIGYVAGTKDGPYGGAPTSLRVETVSTDGKRVRVLARERAASLIWGRPVWTADGKRLLVAVEPH